MSMSVFIMIHSYNRYVFLLLRMFRSRYSCWNEKGATIVTLLPWGGEATMTAKCNTETSRILNAHLHWVQTREKISDVLVLYNNARPHKKPSQILDRQCCCNHPTVLSIHHQIITYLVLRKKGCGDTTTSLTKHYSTLKKASGCRGGKGKLIQWEYMFLSESGRRILTKMETSLTNNYAFSKVVVKCCENFTCPTWKSRNNK